MTRLPDSLAERAAQLPSLEECEGFERGLGVLVETAEVWPSPVLEREITEARQALARRRAELMRAGQ